MVGSAREAVFPVLGELVVVGVLLLLILALASIARDGEMVIVEEGSADIVLRRSYILSIAAVTCVI